MASFMFGILIGMAIGISIGMSAKQKREYTEEERKKMILLGVFLFITALLGAVVLLLKTRGII
ncbi:hypothetical protein GOV13_03125 [Candidatus Pacearchaeota archaeon]|nr:hypothetical protein [Candidatus Pacearchaeota archaeon]